MKVSGKALKFGDNVNTDVILPGKYLVLIDPKELAKHAMEGIDSEFGQKAKDGVILVAGKNFGCGSSREQAPISLKYAGVKCVLAESFARIFYRNAINIGLPILECQEISSSVTEGDKLDVDLNMGLIKNTSKKVELKATPLPKFILELINAGGIIEQLKRRGKWKHTK